jgi:hypothetical protein
MSQANETPGSATLDPAALQRGRTETALLLKLYARATSTDTLDEAAAFRRLRQRLDQASPCRARPTRAFVLGGVLTALLGVVAPILGGRSGAGATGDDRGAGGMEGATGARGTGGR